MAESQLQNGDDRWLPQTTPDGKLYYLNTLTSETTIDAPLTSSRPQTRSFEEIGLAIRGTSARTTHVGEDDEDAEFWIVQTASDGGLYFFNALTGETTCVPPTARYSHFKASESESESESESDTDRDVEEVQEILEGAMPAPRVFPPEWRLQATSDRRLFYYDTLSGNVTFGRSFPRPSLRTVPRDLDFELALRRDLDHDRDDPTARLQVLDKVSKSWDRRLLSDGSVYCYNTETKITSRPCLQLLLIANSHPRHGATCHQSTPRPHSQRPHFRIATSLFH